MRLSTGLALVSSSAIISVTLMGSAGVRPLILVLVVPVYAGLLSVLEATMSFCVFHASRGTYDFSEKFGSPFGMSETRKSVDSEGWRAVDRRKARLMHLEAFAGAIVIVVLFLAL